MGLDMYLSAKWYVKNWEHNGNPWKITVKNNGKAVDGLDVKAITYLTTEVAYWRKANAIHKWFVDNVQDGNDDCGDYYVSSEDLKNLMDTCKEVLDTAKVVDGEVSTGWSMKNGKKVNHTEKGKVITNAEEIADILPTEGGFFFGCTDYDQYYLEEVQRTYDLLKKELDANKNCEYTYTSSW